MDKLLKDNNSKPDVMDERAVSEIADYHACFSGDCPHEVHADCLIAMIEAGVQWARSNPPPEVMALVEILKSSDRNCNFELISERREDGTLLQGTKHSDTCKKCEALRRFEGRG